MRLALGLALIAGPAAAGGMAPEVGLAPVAGEPVLYACANGATVTVTLEPAANGWDTVRLALSGREAVLVRAPAASGTRYVGDGLQWWSKGLVEANLAALAEGEDVASDPGTACAAQASGTM